MRTFAEFMSYLHTFISNAMSFDAIETFTALKIFQLLLFVLVALCAALLIWN
jgi:hypothetical protein